MSADVPRRGRRAAVAAVAALLAILASACQVRVGTDVTVAEDGSGRIAVTVAIDEELASSLAADGFDPFAGLAELPDGWTAEPGEDGRAITVTADFEDPAGLSQRVAQLHEGTDEEDPRLLDDLELAVAEDGSATLTGRAGLRPPSSTGLRGVGVRFDGADLQALLEERGDEVMRADLRVTLPGAITDTNAEEVDGRTATWHLPVTELAEVQAASAPPADRTWWVVGAAVLVGLVVGVVGVGLVRRR